LRIERKYLPPLVVLLLSSIGTSYALSTIFTQNFPPVSSTTPVPSATCMTLTPDGYYSTPAVSTGSPGMETFDCTVTQTGQTLPAFAVPSGMTYPLTPQFTLPAPYSDLFLFRTDTSPPWPPTGGCATIAGGSSIALTSGSPLTLAPGQYNYCADFASAPSTGLPTFSISWMS